MAASSLSMGHSKANRQKSRWHRYLEVSISPTCRISPSPPNNPHNTSPCLSPSLLPWSLAVMLLWLHSKGYAVYPPSLPVTPPPPAATHTHTQTHSISPKSCQRNTVRRITNVSTVCLCRENMVANSNLLQTASNSTADEVSVFVNVWCMCDSHTHTERQKKYTCKKAIVGVCVESLHRGMWNWNAAHSEFNRVLCLSQRWILCKMRACKMSAEYSA